MTAVPPALPGTAQNKRLKESHEFTRLLLGGLQLDNRCEDATLEALSSLANRPSTALAQEQEVGVKWKVTRGWRASQPRTLGCLWVA